MKLLNYLLIFCCTFQLTAQTYSGTITDKNTGAFIEGAKVTLVETNQQITTTSNGQFSFSVSDNSPRTLQIDKSGYVFEDFRSLTPATNIDIQLRAKIKSSATARWENYLSSCTVYNNPNVPNDTDWNVTFTETNLTGDFAPNATYTRRDPSAAIQHNGLYYVWYTYKLSETSTYFGTNNVNDNVFPWDYCDIYYATSPDGYQWSEQGVAVARGASGNFDDRSVFTPEIFEHENKFYLIYQAVKHPYIQRVKNTVAMAVADSPNGPWTKLDAPILRPTDNGIWATNSTSRFDVVEKGDFDSQKVHDPCLMFYNNKFYLYYKGERMGEEKYCGEREIRWGVAIADNPTGPYVKSEYNPITTSGHEVSVWNYDDGIAIIQKLDGPERGSVQFAPDGLNFEMKGTATHVPDALGIFRANSAGSKPTSGVTWGLAHQLKWDGQVDGGWMHLKRFDLVVEVNQPSNSAIVIEAEDFEATKNDVGYTPNGYDGVHANSTGVDHVNRQDWMEFTVSIPESGMYELTYLVSTPSDNANVQLQIDGHIMADTAVPNNGDWNDFRLLQHPTLINIQAGTHTIKVLANGSNDWQWNMDKFYLDKKAELGLEASDDLLNNAIFLFPNPSNSVLNMGNLKTKARFTIYDLLGKAIKQGEVFPNQSIEIQKLEKGLYVLVLYFNAEKQALPFIKE
ncbi:carbohydrate-binding protein [Tamlana sp. I1]|uniref:carbohydrate-binding protein n=1 Tax=Tamlana sp. I1 TaxID=2762061 RepID=UPI00188F468F|nr:carbohydrate-binding protein [Tamlana sp. I1]